MKNPLQNNIAKIFQSAKEFISRRGNELFCKNLSG